MPKATKKAFLKTISIASIAIVLTIVYFAINQATLIKLRGDIIQIIDFFSIIKIVKPIWSTITFVMFVTFLVAVIRRVEENFFTKSSDLYTKSLGVLLAVMLPKSKYHGNHWDREGKVYEWNNPPPDGNPGMPINCRCYAEPIFDIEEEI